MPFPVFTNPALWAGVLALAVPLIVHLLTRKSSRTLVFPTLRFIRKVQANQSAIYRLRHRLLMLVRTAFLALLLLAFLKPVIERRSLAAGDRKDSRHAVVIILDASASMGYAAGGAGLFGRGRLAVEKILDELREADLANLILAGAVPRASFLEPTANRFHLKSDAQMARLTQERADLDAAIRRGLPWQALQRFVGHKHTGRPVDGAAGHQRKRAEAHRGQCQQEFCVTEHVTQRNAEPERPAVRRSHRS